MIPKQDLEKLKPLKDQLQRAKQVKSKRHVSFRKGRLSHRARQWALYITNIQRSIFPKEPKGIRSYGNLPMSERKHG